MYDVNLLVGVLTPLPYSGAVALYMFRWSSGSIHVPCISYVNLDSFWSGANRTPPLDVSFEKGAIRRCVSPSAFAVHWSF